MWLMSDTLFYLPSDHFITNRSARELLPESPASRDRFFLFMYAPALPLLSQVIFRKSHVGLSIIMIRFFVSEPPMYPFVVILLEVPFRCRLWFSLSVNV